MWILWATTCSCLHAASSALMKRVVERSPVLASTFLSVAWGLPVYILLLVMTGVPDIQPGFTPALLAGVVLNIITIPLRNLALRLSPLSLTIPFLAFTPLFLLVTEALFLGDRPGWRGISGVVLIVAGACALQLGEGVGPLGPLRAIARERGSLIMLGVAAIWSLTSVIDKICVVRSSPIFYVSVFNLMYLAGSLPILLATRRPILPTARREWRLLTLIGVAQVGTLITQMLAVQLTLVSYVIAIKRSGMLLSVVIGAAFFGERGLRRRLFAALLMSAGVTLILTGCASDVETPLSPGPGPGNGDPTTIRVPEDEATIQDGIDAADPGDTVLVAPVAPDTYHGPGNRNLDFKGKVLVLRSAAGPEATIIDCQGVGRGFLFEGGQTGAVQVEGFTVRDGLSRGSFPGNAGGGMLCRDSSPRITNCFFVANAADSGGGAFCDSSSAPVFVRCHFSFNSANSGGAIYSVSSSPVFDECTLVANSATVQGGGAMLTVGPSAPELAHCTIAHNTAGDAGGGIACSGPASLTLTLTNCTFYGNLAITGGGLYLEGSATADITNTILSFGPRGNAVDCGPGSDPSRAVLTCCDIFGNQDGDWEGCIAGQAGARGNFSSDPLFCGAGRGDFTLEASSPCAPAQSGSCGLIGALEVACAP